MTTRARASASMRTVASPRPEAPPVTKTTALSNGFNLARLVNCAPHCVVIIRQFDGLVPEPGRDPGESAGVIGDFEVGKLQAVCGRNHNNAVTWTDLAGLAKLDEHGQRHSRVRAVEHACAVRARGSLGQLGLAGLLDDAVVFLQRANRFFY